MGTSTWTVAIGPLGADLTQAQYQRKYKTFEINKKVRMDSCPEFSATIEYKPDVDFNNIIEFKRDDGVEWKGFVEDLEISWDASARYLNLGGRDVSLLLWRKYVENFNNPIKNTGGFFGTVSASELVKFLLRTPRSDLPVSSDQDSNPLVPYVAQYPYNKEGWGLDDSRFEEITANRTGYGDIASTILRTRNLYWSNSNSPYNGQTIIVDSYNGSGNQWNTPVGTSPYLNTDDGDTSYIKSIIGGDYVSGEFSFAPLVGSPTNINNCSIVIRWKPDTTWSPFINSDCFVEIWVASQSAWQSVGDFGGRAQPWANPWQTAQFDISWLLKSVSDINAAKVRFIEHGALSTWITYCLLSVGYGSSGEQSSGVSAYDIANGIPQDWVDINFDEETIMGIYVECREHAGNFPRNYKITTNGGIETFSGYTKYDANSHIVTPSNTEIDFAAYNNETAYFYKDYGAGEITDGFDESFSFMIKDSQPAPRAFIPFCIANDVQTYDILLNQTTQVPFRYMSAIEVANNNSNLTLRFRLKQSSDGSSHGGLYGWLVPAVYDYNSDGIPISYNQKYWVRVTISGTDLRYRIYNNTAMRAGDLIYDTDWKVVTLTFGAGGYTSCVSTDIGLPVYYHGFQVGILQDYNNSTRVWHMFSTMSIPDASIVTILGGTGAGTTSGASSSVWNWDFLYGGLAFRYRYQAITYNGFEWSDTFENSMDTYDIDGQQFANNGFETGDFTGWQGWNTFHPTISTNNPHSGTYCACWNAAGSSIYQSFDNISKTSVLEFYLWYRMVGTYPPDFSVRFYYSDSTTSEYHIYNPSTSWVKINLLPQWTDGKILTRVELLSNTGALATIYIDDVTLMISSTSSWSSANGTATRTTEPTIKAEGTGSQKIHGTANGQCYYFEKDLSLSVYSVIIDGWVYVPAPISGASGQIYLMKVFNKSIAGSSNPSNGYIAAASVIWASAGTWKWQIDGFGGSGTWYTSPPSSSTVINDTWYKLRLKATVSPFIASFSLYNVMNDGSEVLLCDSSTTGLTNNSAYGPIDTYDFEISWDFNNGNGQDAYLDWTKVQTEGEAITDGVIYSGYGAEQVLIDAYDYQTYGHSTTLTANIGTYAFSTPLIQSPQSGDTEIYVNDVSSFYVGEPIIIKDGNFYEINAIVAFDSTNANGVLLQTALANSYSVPNGAVMEGPVASGKPIIHVTSSTGFYDGEPISIFDNLNSEPNIIDSINSSTSITLLNPLLNNYTTTMNAGIKGPCNIYPDIIHSWDPRKLSNLRIYITDDEPRHAWEVSQIYVYKTDDVKYRVADNSVLPAYNPLEIKLTFHPTGGPYTYIPCLDSDIGKNVYVNGFLFPLLWFNNGDLDSSDSSGEYVWHIDATGQPSLSFPAGTSVTIVDGIGAGTLSASAEYVYAGGPYLKIGTELEPATTVAFEYSTPIGPLNIPKNRLLDALFDLSQTINDNYMPYEWWITYDPDTFHIGARRGSDMSGSVSFVTGVTPATNNGVLGGVKYAKSSRDTYQRVQVIGQGEGQGQDATSSFWATDEDAEDEIHGFIEDIFTQKQITNPKLANRYAKIKLKLDASPKRKNAITCLVDYDGYSTGTYDVGDDVSITDILTGLGPSDSEGGIYRIWNIKVIVDINGEKIELTCQAPYLDIGNVWSKVWKELKNLGIVGGIANDWSGEGTNASKVAPDKLSTLFTVTGKDEERTSEPSDNPLWWCTGEPDTGTAQAFTNPPVPDHCTWTSSNSQLIISGGDNTNGGDIEVSAEWAGVVSSDGSTTYATLSNIPAGSILIPVNISLTQNAKFTAEFMVWQSDNGLMGATMDSRWNTGDYADFGIFDHVKRVGFKFRVFCKAPDVFMLYAIFLDGGVIDTSGNDKEGDIDYLIAHGYAKLIRAIFANIKYKIEILTDVSEPTNRLPKSIRTAIFNVYDEGTFQQPNGNPAATIMSAVFMNFDSTLFIKPIYVHAHGTGGPYGLSGGKYSAIVHFYNIKFEDDVI
jgi:hypothetical protein